MDLKLFARRVINGKLLNNGQTCIAPDYVLVPAEMRAELIEQFKVAMEEFYGPFSDLKSSKDYGRIVNAAHFDRVTGVLRRSRGKIVIGGGSDKTTLYIEPTVVVDIPDDDSLMEDEVQFDVELILANHLIGVDFWSTTSRDRL
jgi:acyl-CoA reductase-like NAD-dependent aldehyde dehydrogenase